MTQALSPYEVLGVAKTATRTEVGKTGRSFTLSLHCKQQGT